MILRGSLILLLSGGTDAFQVSLIPTVRTPYKSSTLIASSKTTVPDFSSSNKPIDESDIFADDASSSAAASSWQENLELLLAPDTPVAERQIVLSDLLNSGDKIQDSVRTALRERKVRCIPMVKVVLCSFAICAHADLSTD